MRKAKFYFGLQLSLFEDRQGFKFAFKFKLMKLGIEKTLFIRRNPDWGKGNSDLTPKFPDPTILTEVPTGKVIEPEDM